MLNLSFKTIPEGYDHHGILKSNWNNPAYDGDQCLVQRFKTQKY